MEEDRNDNVNEPIESVETTEEVELTAWGKVKRTTKTIDRAIGILSAIGILAVLIYYFGFANSAAPVEHRDPVWDGNGITTTSWNDMMTTIVSPDAYGLWMGEIPGVSGKYVMTLVADYDGVQDLGAPIALAWVEDDSTVSNICYGTATTYGPTGEAITEKNVIPFNLNYSTLSQVNQITVYYQDNYGAVIHVKDVVPGLEAECYRVSIWDDIKDTVHGYSFQDFAYTLPLIGPVMNHAVQDGKVLGHKETFDRARTHSMIEVGANKANTLMSDRRKPQGIYQYSDAFYRYQITIAPYSDIHTDDGREIEAIRFERWDMYGNYTGAVDFHAEVSTEKKPIELWLTNSATGENQYYGNICFYQNGCAYIPDLASILSTRLDIDQYTVPNVFFTNTDMGTLLLSAYDVDMSNVLTITP